MNTAQAEPLADETQAKAALPQRPLRILLAEDNAVNRMLAIRLLAKEGHSAVCANDGLEAVEILSLDTAFDLILMDLQMPRMDGFEATCAIRKAENEAAGDRRQHQLPMIALTAHVMKGDDARCVAARMDDYFVEADQQTGVAREAEEVVTAANLECFRCYLQLDSRSALWKARTGHRWLSELLSVRML